MQSRRPLALLVGTLLLLGLAAAVWGLAQSMSLSERELDNAATLVEIGSVAPGELKAIDVQKYGRKLFVYRPTAEVMEDLKRLNSHVWNPRITSYNEEHGLFIYWGQSTKFGQELTHMPKGKTVFDQYGELGHVWLGGYFDRIHDPSYDYAGRTIKSYEFTYNGYNAEHPNLIVPTYQFEKNDVLLIKHP